MSKLIELGRVSRETNSMFAACVSKVQTDGTPSQLRCYDADDNDIGACHKANKNNPVGFTCK